MKNHSDELIFHSQGLRRNAANLGIASEKSPSRISPRGLSAKRFDMEEKMNSALEKLLLSELRIVVYEPEHAPGSSEAASAQPPLSDEQITKAMTVNEELRNLGYTLKPGKIVALAVPLLRPEELAGIPIPFKENLVLLFDAVLEGTDGPDRILYLRQICQHTGDVMKCVRGVLAKNRYHLRTGQKRAVVKLLETYPVEDFKANLILSRAGREKNLISLKYLDYNMYSRSDAHKEAVRALRNGELRSWEAQALFLPR